MALKYKKTIIKMPSSITTFEEYKEWSKSLYIAPVNCMGERTFNVQMKRRSSYQPQSMTTKKDYYSEAEDPTTVQYLITDGVSRGEAKVKSFNKIFTFYTEEWVDEKN